MSASVPSLSMRVMIVAMALTSYALSFSLRAPTRVCSNPRIARSSAIAVGGPTRPILTLNMAEGEVVDDDDGWGEESAEPSSSPPASEGIPSKSQELQMLQNDLASKQGKRQAPSADTDGERDLFIPIVTAVSVIGFTGLYGYEMLRLYSRGELYVPWEN